MVCVSASASVRVAASSFCFSASCGAFGDALLPLRRGGRPLLLDRLHPALQVGMEPVDSLESSFCPAPPLFQAGQFRRNLRGLLLQALALLAHQGKLSLQLIQAGLGLRVLGLQPHSFFALLVDGLALGLAGILVARGLHGPILQPALDALRLALHLLQGRAQVGGVGLRNAPLFAERLQLRRHFFDGPRQDRGFSLRLRQTGLEFRQPDFGLAQLTLQRQRTFAGRLAAGHRRVVETLALGSKKIRVRIAAR